MGAGWVKERAVAGEVWQFVDSGGVGGIESHIRTLAGGLAASGVPVRVVRLAHHGDEVFARQLAEAGLTVETLDGRFGTLLRRLRQDRPALLHTHGYKAGLLGRLAARLAGIPCVSTFHAGERGAFPVSLYQTLDEATARLAARIAVSEPIAARLPAPVAVIDNFVPVPLTPPPPPQAEAVGFVGRLSPEKGPDLFCEIAVHCSDLAFDLYGDGPMRPALEAKYAGRIRFHGFVARPADIWPQIGLLLMPSRAEGLPMAAIEAMAAGVPVAAAAVGALPQVVRPGETGWLFPPEDIDAAVAAVRAWRAAGPDGRAAYSRAAWEAARARFGLDAGLARIRAVYERVAPGALSSGAGNVDA